MFDQPSAELQEFLQVQVILTIVGPPAANLEVWRSHAIANVVDRWQQGEFFLILSTATFRFITVVSTDQGPFERLSGVSVPFSPIQHSSMDRFLVLQLICSLVTAASVPSFVRCCLALQPADVVVPSAYAVQKWGSLYLRTDITRSLKPYIGPTGVRRTPIPIAAFASPGSDSLKLFHLSLESVEITARFLE